jgi:proline iminopeptidase
MKKLFKFTFLLCFVWWYAAGDCLGQTPREGFITAPDGVRLFYKMVGSGEEILVAVHGGPGNSLNSILPDLEPLAKNRTVVYYDQRGGGRSELIKDGEKLSISKHIEDLETVRKFFKLDRMTLLGNSWGGLLIGFYAASHPDRVERMVLHAPASPTRDFMFEMKEEVERRYKDDQCKRYRTLFDPQPWLNARDPRAVCREFYQTLLAVYTFDAGSMKSFKGDVCFGPDEAVRTQLIVNDQILRSLGNWNLLPSLSAVKAPVLVVHGAADVIPVKSSEAWAGAMPNARLLVIEKSGHMPQFEQPGIFFKAVETFLKGDFPPGAKRISTSAEKN